MSDKLKQLRSYAKGGKPAPVAPAARIFTEKTTEIIRDTPEDIAFKLNTLKGAVKSDVIDGMLTMEDVVKGIKGKLEPRDIKGMPINMNDMRWHGSGLTEVIHDTTLTGKGTTASPLSVVAGGSGVTSINADTTAAQTLAVGTTGTNFAIVDGGAGLHTFNLPTASASNRGALSSTDWSTFNSKQSALTFGNLTDVGTDGITIGSGSGAVIGTGTTISQHVADSSHNGYLSSTDWSTFNNKGSGTVTAVSVASANGFAGSSSGGATPALTLSTTITGTLQGNGTAISASKVTLTQPGTGSTLTIIDGKTLTVNKSLTLDGTDSTTMTFPSTSATIARTDAAQTFTGAQTYSNAVIYTNNAIAASSNAATVPVTARLNTVTNSSAATLTITMTTTSAVDGQLTMVRVLDFSGVTQTIAWVNTENSNTSVPTTSNGSTTLPLTVGFQFNGATTKWRCLASA